MQLLKHSHKRERAFIQKTYTHLAGAVGAFIAARVRFILDWNCRSLREMLYWAIRFAWLAVLGAFALLGWLSSSVWQLERIMLAVSNIWG